MSTAANIYTAFGIETGDPANSLIPVQRLELWLNRVVKEAVERTNALWDLTEISGLYDIEIVSFAGLVGNTITLRTSVDSAASDYVIASAASNAAMATAIAVQLDAHPNVTAYASGVHVYVGVIGGGTISSLTCDNSSSFTVVTLSTSALMTFLQFGRLTGDTITLKTSIDTVAVNYTIAAAASNAAMATAVEIQLEAHANVAAVVIGDAVSIVVTGGTIETFTINEASTITLTDGAEFFSLASLITNFRRIEEVYSVDDQVHYKPIGYQEYVRCALDGAFDGYVYSIPVEAGAYMLYVKASGANLSSANTITISHLLWPTSITSAATAMPGILDHHDDLVVKGMLYYYYNQKGQFEVALGMRKIFERWCRQAKKEIRMQGKPQEMGHFLRVAND